MERRVPHESARGPCELDAIALGIYVDLFDACGEEDVTFTASVYRRRAREDGTFRLEETERRRGTLVADYDAYGGAAAPLFVMAVELP